MKKNNLLKILGGIIIFSLLLASIIYIKNKTSPIETNWSEVKMIFLNNQEIERIVIINNKRANIYIKKDSLYKFNQLQDNFFIPLSKRAHYTFNIGSVEIFERNLREAQVQNDINVLPEYKTENNWFGEVFWTGMPIILILLLLFVYFIPTYIAVGKENQIFIILLNIFVGWTILGWIGALTWAIASKKIKKELIYVCTNCNYKYEIDQKVNLFVCPNCQKENNMSGI